MARRKVVTPECMRELKVIEENDMYKRETALQFAIFPPFDFFADDKSDELEKRLLEELKVINELKDGETHRVLLDVRLRLNRKITDEEMIAIAYYYGRYYGRESQRKTITNTNE